MKFYPLFFQLKNKPCLIVGGGAVALRRVRSLCSADAIVDVVASVITEELKQLVSDNHGTCYEQDFTADHLQSHYRCVVAATDSKEVNDSVANIAQQKNIAVNVVDNPERGDFIFPSVIDRGPLTIAISNNGNSPVLSRILKQQVEQFVPKSYGELSVFVGDNRAKVKSVISDTKTRAHFWEAVLQGAVAEAIFSGKKAEAQRLLETLLADKSGQFNVGEVYLIGAGPGDPDLLTLRAFRLLQQADVVLYDRLVSDEVMALIKPDVELVYVGKRRDQHSVPQGGINQLLVDHAKQGKRVARLKGGDPFIFGRGGEEIETLFEENIPFQVVPGITAANGCSAYSGIPLTHRDYAQSVQFVTGQLKDGSIDLNWKELIAPGKTLVFYMGLKSLPVICSALIENGMDATTSVALVEKGTTQQQRVLVETLTSLPEVLKQESISSPSLFIVGDVVKLAKKLSWFRQ